MSEEDESSSSSEDIDPNIYRFNGMRGGWRGPSTWGPDEWVPQEPGSYTYPKGDQADSSGIIELP